MSRPLSAIEPRPKEGGATYSGRHRLFRTVWSVVWNVLGVWTPVPLHAWRRLLARIFGARIHRTATICPVVRGWNPPNLTLGMFGTLGVGVHCYAMAPITLADFAIDTMKAFT